MPEKSEMAFSGVVNGCIWQGFLFYFKLFFWLDP
jgi:hypothetical protein